MLKTVEAECHLLVLVAESGSVILLYECIGDIYLLAKLNYRSEINSTVSTGADGTLRIA